MKKSTLLNSPKVLEIKKKRRQILKHKIMILGGITCVFLGFIIFILNLPKLNITEVNVLGNKIIETKDIKNIITNTISNKFLLTIPKTSLLFIPKNKIKDNLEAQYKRLKDIEINITGDRVLEVFVSERTPLYTWCGEKITEDTKLADTKCYFMDESGFIFDEAPYFSGDVYFRFFGSILDNTNPNGTYFLGTDFQKIESFYKLIAQMDLTPISMEILNPEMAEIRLDSKHDFEQAPKIIFNPENDLLKLAENLKSALSTEPLQTDIKDKYTNLSYIDLRFVNRVYYKFRE